MLINISELDPRGCAIDAQIEVPAFVWDGGQDVVVSPVAFSGSLRRRGDRVELEGRFHTDAEFICIRCLEPVTRRVEGTFRLVVLPSALGPDEGRQWRAVPNEEDRAGEDLYPLVGSVLDMTEVLREQVDLQLPLKIVCRAECSGLCAGCGTNLNREACSCSRSTDMRWDALIDWKRRRESS